MKYEAKIKLKFLENFFFKRQKPAPASAEPAEKFN